MHALPNQLCAVSAFKEEQRQEDSKPPPKQSCFSSACQSCNRQHSLRRLPVTASNCNSCSQMGHWAKSPSWVASAVQCYKKNNNCHLVCPGRTNRSPQPISMRLVCDNRISGLQMLLLDTGIDVTMIDTCHLQKLHI